MYILKSTTKNELRKVQATINKELASEKIIQDIYEYIFNVEGKKTRALISLLASKSSKIRLSVRTDLASIIELLHTATLVHDDVVDESELRRGTKSRKPSLDKFIQCINWRFYIFKSFYINGKTWYSIYIR